MSDYCEAFKISSSTNRFACLGDDDDDGECRTSDSSGSHIITKLHPNDVFLGGIKPCQVYTDAIKEVYSQWDFTTMGNQIKKRQKQSVIDTVKASGGRCVCVCISFIVYPLLHVISLVSNCHFDNVLDKDSCRLGTKMANGKLCQTSMHLTKCIML